MTVIYLTIEQAIDTHRKTVEVSGGGTLEHLDLGKLASVLDHIQNDDYYPTFEDKLTHLFFSANKFHCFADGNKRIAITLCTQMLLFNGYLYCATRFLREMENISYHVAAGNIDRDLLHEIITAFLAEEMDDEGLKLKIFNAIAGNDDETEV
ncbi:death-on-curing protein [Methylobacter tundripaludum]|uniref:Death-on-curing protein n=1 Tax=Methylobacter tundripaludum TaxID=173365 RepID=A0A2S6H7T4_9GAMM|nr:Fic family protein [Methylobacter tundripaludum]PPK73552.1 death-on-curing protein [Methylobacter tundripaludum]